MDADASARRAFHVESLGCAKNQVDSERMIAALVGAGWRLAAAPQDAEVLIVNTCGFISSAKKESIETSLELKQRYPGKKVVMVGCLSERYGQDLARELPEIDGFLGNRDPSLILDLLSNERNRGEAVQRASGPRTYERSHLLSFPGSAYLKIAEGCGNRCTYCAIPLIRGELASRQPSEIVAEAKQLLDRGIRELVLIAQDLGSYGRDSGGPSALPSLLTELSGLSGDFWVRLLYIHPDHFPYAILDVMAHDPRFLPYFDLPFQHAAPGVLRAMGRRADPEANLALVARIRELLPGAVIRSTFLLGFPGETERDFEDLLSFQSRARPDWLGCFNYSREEDTPAYTMRGRVAKAVAESRKAQVQLRQGPITQRALEAHVGKTLDVLVEERVEGEELSLGRAYLQAPDVDGLVVVRRSMQPGTRCAVLIERRNGVDLEGSPRER
ncbi:MAG: 30S ribosomal protein S12 methylthiotransferase RimO [Spirochaetia bacterium]|jgi:ribosomal protein S12 methylthiotransferase